MRQIWRTVLGGTILLAAMGVAGSSVCAQGVTGSASQRPRKTPSPLPPLPATQLDTRTTTPTAPADRQPRSSASQLPVLPATQLDGRLPGPGGPENFSLSFSEPQSIRDVVLLMVKDTGLSVAIDPDVTGTFTGELAHVTLQRALDITLTPLGLAYTLENHVLHVFRRPTETRFFSIDHVSTKRSSDRTTSARLASSGGATVVTSSDASDFYDDLGTTVRSLLSREGVFTIDRKAGLLQVTDYPDRLDRVSQYLELAAARVARQVQIQATVVAVDLNQGSSAGIDWRVVLSAAGGAVNVSGQRSGMARGEPGGMSVNVTDVDGLLRALASQGRVRVLARPRVSAMNNEPALVRVGTDGVAAGTDDGQSDGRGKRQGGAEPGIADAIVLSVTPQISADGWIQMSVAPVVAAPRDGVLPPITVQGADTVVRVHAGEMVLLGGVMQAAGRAGRPRPERPGKAGTAARRSPADQTAADTAATGTELVILLSPALM